jgi:hypothetical protein
MPTGRRWRRRGRPDGSRGQRRSERPRNSQERFSGYGDSLKRTGAWGLRLTESARGPLGPAAPGASDLTPSPWYLLGGWMLERRSLRPPERLGAGQEHLE